MNHPHPRTERDLRWLAESFSAGRIARGIPERLECLAAWWRVVAEADKALSNEPNDYDGANAALSTSIGRMRAAGVGESDGEFTFSPWCGPDC